MFKVEASSQASLAFIFVVCSQAFLYGERAYVLPWLSHVRGFPIKFLQVHCSHQTKSTDSHKQSSTFSPSISNQIQHFSLVKSHVLFFPVLAWIKLLLNSRAAKLLVFFAGPSCLSSECCNRNIRNWWLMCQKPISDSSEGWEVQDQGGD